MESAFPDTSSRSSSPQYLAGLPDSALLRDFAISGSEAAFHVLVRRHAGLVLAIACRRLGGDAGLAEDAAQQTFIALARNPGRAARAPSLAAWLHRAAVFEAGNLLRRETRHRARNLAVATAGLASAGPDALPATEAEFSGSSIAAAGGGAFEELSPAVFCRTGGEKAASWRAAEPHLDKALAALSETDRSVLILHHLEGRTYAEIAARLGCSAAAAQRRGHRALGKLSTQLRRRGVVLPVSVLAGGLGSVLAPSGTGAAATATSVTTGTAAVWAARALSSAAAAAGAVGAGGVLGILLAPPLLGTVTVLLALAATWLAARHFENGGLPSSAAPASGVSPAASPFPAVRRQAPPGAALPRKPAQPPFEMDSPDEKLSEDERTFVTLAKTDAAAALEWARKKFPSEEALGAFISKKFSTGKTEQARAGRALADRDLEAADRVLDLVAVNDFGMFDSIFASRLARDFSAAIGWADAWNLAHPASARAPFLLHLQSGISAREAGTWGPDIPGALAVSRSPLVRQSLLDLQCLQLMAQDEGALKPLADTLSGDERRQVLEYHLSVLLMRGDPSAAAALEEIKPGKLHDTRGIAMRGPAVVMDYQMSRPVDYSDSFSQTVGQLGVDWMRVDEEAAQAWAAIYSEQDLQEHGFSMMTQMLKQKGGPQ